MLPREPRFFVSRSAIEGGGDASGSAADRYVFGLKTEATSGKPQQKTSRSGHYKELTENENRANSLALRVSEWFEVAFALRVRVKPTLLRLIRNVPFRSRLCHIQEFPRD